MEDPPMRTFPFRRTAAVVLLFSLLLWTVGCTSYQAVENWREHPEITLYVTTKDEAAYELIHWKTDSLGNLSGKGTVTVPWHWPAEFEGSILADSIAAVKAERDDWREHPEVVPVRITMADGTEYELNQWRVDTLGIVSGKGTVRQPWTWHDVAHMQRTAEYFQGVIPADSISSVQTNQANVVGTAVLMVLAFAVIYFIENPIRGFGYAPSIPL